MSTASLSLLKKGKKDAMADELAKTETPAAPEAPADPVVAETDEAVTVDIENMSEAQLDEFVAEQGIETPDTWVSLGHAGKIAWMNAQFGGEQQSGTAQELAAAHDVLTGKSSVADPATQVGPKSSVATMDLASAASAGAEAATKPKKGKSKAVAKTDAVTGEIMEPDILQDLIHEIETMKEKEALALVATLTEQNEMSTFKLGGVLSLVKANEWYKPYAHFHEWVEKEHGLHYRKASYYIEIYDRLSGSGVPWSKVKSVGWTKLKEIAKVLTVDNVDEWVKIASEQNTITLIDTVKNFLAKDANKALEDQESKTVTNMTFKVHDAQKVTIEGALAKAMEVTGTQVKTAALEFVCMDYMNSLSLTGRLKAVGLEKALKAFEEAFPTANLTLDMTDGEEAAAA